MILEGLLYGFCIGNGYTGEKLPKIRSRKVQKLEDNVEFELNGSLRGAEELKLGPDGSKNTLNSNPSSVCSQMCVFGLF